MQRLGRVLLASLLGISGVVAVVAVSTSTAGACSLALPFVDAGTSEVRPGDALTLDAMLYELDGVSETTSSTSATSTSQPEIEPCPPTRAVDRVQFRFVQGDDATDLVAVEPADERLSTTVSVPAGATAGAARIVASVNGEAMATSDVITVVRPASPPAPPTVGAPDFTG